MKNTEGITWMHLPEIVAKGIEFRKDLEDPSQGMKWISAKINAPSWKKAEYGAQSRAWLEDELNSWHDWCNPLARA